MSKRLLLAAALAILVTILSMVIVPNQTEAQRVEREAREAIKAIKLINTGRVKTSPGLMADMLLHPRRDHFRFHADQFDFALRRLRQLGVVQQRTFRIRDTNGAPAKIQVLQMFATNDVLWSVSGAFSNGDFVVTALPDVMPRWEALQRTYESNYASGRRTN
jgi:hypothetical protein